MEVVNDSDSDAASIRRTMEWTGLPLTLSDDVLYSEGRFGFFRQSCKLVHMCTCGPGQSPHRTFAQTTLHGEQEALCGIKV